MPVSACAEGDANCLFIGAGSGSAATTSLPLANTALPDQEASTTSAATPLPTPTSIEPVNTGLSSSSIVAALSPVASNPASSDPAVLNPTEPSSTSTSQSPTPSDSLQSKSTPQAGSPSSPNPAGTQAIAVPGHILSVASSAGLAVGNTVDAASLTYTLPGATTSPANAEQSVAVYEGQTISGVAIASSVAVVGGQTLSVGGSVITLSGNQVASLGSSGIVVQAAGGAVTTILIPKASSTSTSIPIVTGNAGVASTVKVNGTTSSTTPTPPLTSIGALIMANFSAAGRSRELGGSVLARFVACLLGTLYLL